MPKSEAYKPNSGAPRLSLRNTNLDLDLEKDTHTIYSQNFIEGTHLHIVDPPIIVRCT